MFETRVRVQNEPTLSKLAAPTTKSNIQRADKQNEVISKTLSEYVGRCSSRPPLYY